jgi:hypothetical protein
MTTWSTAATEFNIDNEKILIWNPNNASSSPNAVSRVNADRVATVVRSVPSISGSLPAKSGLPLLKPNARDSLRKKDRAKLPPSFHGERSALAGAMDPEGNWADSGASIRMTSDATVAETRSRTDSANLSSEILLLHNPHREKSDGVVVLPPPRVAPPRNDSPNDNADFFSPKVQHISPISSSVVLQQQQQSLEHTLSGKITDGTDHSSTTSSSTSHTPIQSHPPMTTATTKWKLPPPPGDDTPIRRTSAARGRTVLPNPPSPQRIRENGAAQEEMVTPTSAREGVSKEILLTPLKANRSFLDLPDTAPHLLEETSPETAVKSSSSGKPPLALLKAALARPFGREPSILPNPHCWVVEVSAAEWDADHEHWKYRILVQRRHTTTERQNHPSSHARDQPSSFTTAFTWRTISDFLWLEQALHQEFQGSLLVPSVAAMANLDPDKATKTTISDQTPLEASVLKYWLADILNGIRGSGEWILPIVQQQHPGPDLIDVIKCESMESFLYRNTLDSAVRDSTATRRSTPKSADDLGAGCQDATAASCNDSGFMNSILSAAFSPLELCVGPDPEPMESTPRSNGRNDPRLVNPSSRFPKPQLPLSVMNCSSRAIGTASDLNIEDSIIDTNSIMSGMSSLSPKGSTEGAIHSELIFAERELAQNYVLTARSALSKLDTLRKAEEKVGHSWKRLAMSLANLFSYEKDVETANVGTSKVKRENMPYRKIEKSVVEECLRVLAKQKMDRAVPGLTILATMLSAYHADVGSVDASVAVYAKAVYRLIHPTAEPLVSGDGSDSAEVTSTTGSSSQSSQPVKKPLKAWNDLKEWTLRNLNSGRDGANPADQAPVRDTRTGHPQEHTRKLLLVNERRLRVALTTMFRTAPFRISRMAWRYWHTEASHCAMLNSAAAELRTKLDIVSPSSVSKLLKRHSKEEKSDCAMEMELIQRIVHLGHKKRFPSGNDSLGEGGSVSTTSIKNELVEVDNDDLSVERTKAMQRDKALEIARRRIGRWNAALAMAIMEAVGVDDPNVRVEETTRDLRLVRKYAIGLRECLNRCVEAVNLLREAITGNAVPASSVPTSTGELSPALSNQDHLATNRLKELRQNFLEEMSLTFSGTWVNSTPNGTAAPKRSTASQSVLHAAGIDTRDPAGWIPVATTATPRGSQRILSPGRVGNHAVQYVQTRDAHVEWLLSSLDGLLKEYYQRIEVIEGFVFMECVGIQLEKHCSTQRAQALSMFEKKTDWTTAANMARKKRLPQLVSELQAKLEQLGPAVSHTTVKETKEAHLESKQLKTSLHELALRRLLRAQETSTERVVTILALWAKEEEINATEEIKALGEAMSVLEKSVCRDV